MGDKFVSRPDQVVMTHMSMRRRILDESHIQFQVILMTYGDRRVPLGWLCLGYTLSCQSIRIHNCYTNGSCNGYHKLFITQRLAPRIINAKTNGSQGCVVSTRNSGTSLGDVTRKLRFHRWGGGL